VDNCNFFAWDEKVEKLKKQYKWVIAVIELLALS